ncbi:MAG TPA: hypothetical protein PKZ32_03865 [Candidatus Melainabacteria bacterium]|nr:hypothetical protein [Candidatus Melainabacteria bacterium]
MSSNILNLFGAVLAVIFLWSFVRAKVWKELSTKNLFSSFKPLLYVLIPLSVLALIGTFAKVCTYWNVAYIALGALVPYILSQISLPVFYRSIIMLVLGALVVLHPGAAVSDITSVLIGLISWKAMENMYKLPESTFEDMLPAFVFLASSFWFGISGASDVEVRNATLVLSALVIGLFLRWSERPLVGNDPYWWRRILIAASGGLFLLIVINKLLLAPSIATIAALGGASYFFAYLFESMTLQEGEKGEMLKGFKSLVFVGILTLLATRLFGTLGLCIVASGAVVARKPGLAQTVGIFFASRVLLQGFLSAYNPNVTGVNIMHTYCYAAMFGGILAMFVISSLFRETEARKYLPFALVGAGVTLPVVSNYFLHAEPSGALLSSALVGAVLLAVFLEHAYDLKLPQHENIILVPPLMMSVAYMTGSLIELGNDAPSNLKTQVIAVLLVAAIIVCVVNHLLTGRKGPVAPSEPEPKPE